MIPFASLSGVMIAGDGTRRSFSIRDLSVLGFTFSGGLLPGLTGVEICFHRPGGDRLCVLPADRLIFSPEDGEEDVLRAETEDASFASLIREYMRESGEYTSLRQAGDPAAMAAALTGYSAYRETRFAASRREWLRQRMTALRPDAQWAAVWQTVPRVTLALRAPGDHARFLAAPFDRFCREYFDARCLAEHPVSRRVPDGILLGSEVCPRLVPDEDALAALYRRAREQRLAPMLALPPCEEHTLSPLLNAADAWIRLHDGETAELAVNDWGLAAALHRAHGSRISLTLGSLLMKQRRDVRLPLLRGFGGRGSLQSQSSMYRGDFREWMRDALGIDCLCVDAPGYPVDLPDGDYALRLPFYAMNTAAHCTLRSVLQYGDRSHPVQTPCAFECEHAQLIYPDSVDMIGIGNALFGVDLRIMESGDALRGMIGPGCRRAVIDLL